ncbi:Aldose 1-epimerase precursor [Tsuneonella dongtanensis]|uniref:Aldose 1-epimerase n=1 Tax=Tsuneonella dongtanensis TaxID=692370 RepID=A0A1B2AB08_9SPHN|nr:aldose epimerase family protein [Tsuneonella dongtanensis]ANY19322.1 Aldose 1-epimerase precursor [Tsuneonella dongtanensis]
MRKLVIGAAMALALAACDQAATQPEGTTEEGAMTGTPFEKLADGREVTKWDLRGADGSGPIIMDLGATILSLQAPDMAGEMADVTFGFDTAAPYLTDSPYFGAVVGRYANRIKEGKFSLDGKDYTLAINNEPNTLHGGKVGFDKRVWKGEPVTTADGKGVKFTLVSPDGEEGYPGEVTVSTTYVWTADHKLIVDFDATTTANTPFNIAQHSYWNLAGANTAKTVLDHTLQINADKYTPVTKNLIPTGELPPVEGTPFDFRTAKPIGRDIGQSNEQLTFGGGFDHNWVLNGSGMRVAAVLVDPTSGRRMTVSTDQPGLQFYSGNFLDGKVTGKGGNAYPYRSAVALETQYFPDSPNQTGFPDATLRPGKPFHSRTIYAFDTVATN